MNTFASFSKIFLRRACSLSSITYLGSSSAKHLLGSFSVNALGAGSADKSGSFESAIGIGVLVG